MGPKAQKQSAAPAPVEVVRKSVQFSDAKVHELLQIIRALNLKPIGSEMWREVEAEFNALAATRPHFHQRPALSLKQKFVILCEVKKPTGDPTMPANIHLA